MPPVDRRPPPIWLLTLVLAVASITIVFTQLVQLSERSLSVTTALLVVAFIATEYFVVHLHFRSESSTFSFTEVPLILGAIFIAPLHAWAAMTCGTALALVFLRKQPPVKASFNIANLSLQGATALWVFHSFRDPDNVLGVQDWAAAAGAAVASSALTVATFVVVVTMIEGRINLRGIRETLTMSSLTSITNVAVALIAAILIDTRPAALLLLSVPLAVIFVAYRSFLSEREHRERMQDIYELTSEIRGMRHQSAIPDILASAAARLRAARCDLFLLPVNGATQPPTWFCADAGETAIKPLHAGELGAATALVSSSKQTRFSTESDLALLASLVGTDMTSAMVSVVRSDEGDIGVLSIANRLGDIAKFNPGDLALFSTMADQLALALENDQLGQAVTELKRVERQLSEQANHDALTGLANRHLLASELSDAIDGGHEVSVLYIDVDDFKMINDGLGHEAGDLVLIEISHRIRNALGAKDCVARIGGDEFVVVLVDPRNDLDTADRLLEIINRPILLGDHEARVGVSIGLSRARADQDANLLIASADAAMYRAKGTGKGGVSLDKQAQPTGFRTAATR